MSGFRNLLDEAVTSLLRRLDPGSSRNTSNTCSPTCPSGEQEISSICHNPEQLSDWDAHEIHQLQQLSSGNQCSWVIPVAGNAFLCNCTSQDIPLLNSANQLTENGLVNWTTAETKVSCFIHCVQPGPYLVAFRLQVPKRNTSRIRVSLTSCTKQQCQAPQNYDVSLQGNNDKIYQIIPCGRFTVTSTGYVKIDLVGMQKSGSVFANISHAILIPQDEGNAGPARAKRSISPEESQIEKTSLKFVSDPDDFYFGRRGPSVHLNYLVPQHPDRNIEYFYNELIVPTGQDVVGAYYCAIGFSGGYFGIQVNSATERRFLFSIWSAYSTDNPQDIPSDFKVHLLKKGSDVQIGEFGNEGSGGQSYLRHNWKSSRVYKFIVHAKPLDENNTKYSAWFCDSTTEIDGIGEWRLIASFKKPKVSAYLEGLYSFSENFIPEMGHVERYCVFGNQWGWDSSKREWVEVTNVKFTADATAMKETRKDIAAGLMEGDGGFYLRNCGFFSDAVEPGTQFCRRACGSPPNVDLLSLP